MSTRRNPAYARHLKTTKWNQTRKAALQRAGYRCQVCNSPDSLNVHHRTYERLGHEHPMDLTVLCRVCHKIFHRRRGLNTKGAGGEPGLTVYDVSEANELDDALDAALQFD